MRGINTLFLDIEKDDLEAVKSVVKDNLNITDNYGRTPLINAALYCKNEIIEWLLEHGANPNLQDKNGYTALHFSAQECHTKTTQLLLQNGVDINIQDKNGNTASWVAIMYWKGGENFKTLKMLYDKGADLTLKNKAGKSAIELIPKPIKDKLGIKISFWNRLFK